MHKQHENSDGDSDKWQKREHYRHQYTPDSYAEKKAFRHASTNLGFAGVAGHMVRTGGVLLPLVIGEFVKDPDKKWKAIRLSAVAAAVISEALYMWERGKKNQAHEVRDDELENRLQSALASCGMADAGIGR